MSAPQTRIMNGATLCCQFYANEGIAMYPMGYKPLSRQERLKYEAAEELGLLEKLIEVGWSGLTARETGLIGARVRGDMGR